MNEIDLWSRVISTAAGTGLGSLILVVVVWYLLKMYLTERDKRVEALEKRSAACEEDRKELHSEINSLQGEVRELYKNMIK